MRLSRNMKRAALTAVTALVTTTALAGAAAPAAHAAVFEETTLTIPTPDVEFGALGCTTTFKTTPGFRTGSPALGESAAVYVSSQGCGPVAWVPSVYILDGAPNRPTYGTGAAGGSGSNPATRSTSQEVAYGVGVREVAVVRMWFAAESRLGRLCLAQEWEFDALTWRLKPLTSSPCQVTDYV